MFLGYNTNGFAHHRLEDAITILAEIGYRGIAITLDYHALNPIEDIKEQLHRVKQLLSRYNLHCVIETGARFILDPKRKHAPTLLDPTPFERHRRSDFLMRAIKIAYELRADAVSFWSGAKPPEMSETQAMSQLIDECRRLIESAERYQMPLAFEPEPGMFIDTMDRFSELHAAVDHPLFGLTLDVGHVHCLNDGEIADHIKNWHAQLFNIHIEDMKKGKHDHLVFGEGEINFPPIINALKEVNYTGGLNVELSRHSHDAVNIAQQSYQFLNVLL